MQVTLAGYNIDSSLIRALNNPSATPEVISAAYARISRSEKSVTELRGEALAELAKARRSNQTIVFDLGHASVAEHAVFNFDIIGISRLLTDSLETLRFASFTEKSQRYVTFAKDYVVPSELDQPGCQALKEIYCAVLDSLFVEYQASFEALKEYHASRSPELSAQDLDGRAKEDARYILPLATTTQLGMTLNARSLENLLRRLVSHPLREAGELYTELLNQAREVCPSLVRYVEAEPFEGSFQLLETGTPTEAWGDEEPLRLVDSTPDAGDRILAALLYEQSQASWQRCRETVANLSAEARSELWEQVFAGIQPWSKMPRAFELADFILELNISESCWAQFKRHRVGTLIRQKRSLAALPVIPELIRAVGREEHWMELLNGASDLRANLTARSPHLAGYARTNADRVRVLVKMNLREIYHLVRLRSDAHAQWEINRLSHRIVEQLRAVAPQATALLCGKSEFDALAADCSCQKD